MHHELRSQGLGESGNDVGEKTSKEPDGETLEPLTHSLKRTLPRPTPFLKGAYPSVLGSAFRDVVAELGDEAGGDPGVSCLFEEEKELKEAHFLHLLGGEKP